MEDGGDTDIRIGECFSLLFQMHTYLKYALNTNAVQHNSISLSVPVTIILNQIEIK